MLLAVSVCSGRDSNVFEEGSDSGVAAYTPNHVNNSFEPESDSDAHKPHSVSIFC